LVRDQRYSILPAYSLNGYLPRAVIEPSGVSKSQFTAFIINNVLPYINEYDINGENSRSVLIIDNYGIHQSEELIEAYLKAKIRVEFLPPYSPDFNPIELSFNSVKQWVKANFSLSNNFNDFADFLRYAVEQSGANRYAESHFRHYGYIFHGEIEGDLEIDIARNASSYL